MILVPSSPGLPYNMHYKYQVPASNREVLETGVRDSTSIRSRHSCKTIQPAIEKTRSFLTVTVPEIQPGSYNRTVINVFVVFCSVAMGVGRLFPGSFTTTRCVRATSGRLTGERRIRAEITRMRIFFEMRTNHLGFVKSRESGI